MKTHEAVVNAQFGAQANAYLASAVHASGEDLAAIAALAAACRPAAALDLGCGAGHVSFALAAHAAQVTACDLSAEMLTVVAAAAAERGLANVATRQGVAEALPFADASFDFVASRFSAHHWRDLRAGLREAARVLRPGGIAVFADTVAPQDALLDTALQAIELLRDPSHVRDYARAEWETALAEAGLRVTRATARRLPLEFAAWVARMRTPAVQVAAIRALQAAVSEEVRRHYEIAADGSFVLDTLMLECAAA